MRFPHRSVNVPILWELPVVWTPQSQSRLFFFNVFPARRIGLFPGAGVPVSSQSCYRVPGTISHSKDLREQ